MEKQNLQAFPFKEIREKIEEKRDIYISLIRSTFNFSSQSEEEKTQIANDTFTSEQELYIERLKDVWQEANDEYLKKGTVTTLTLFKGVNIFMEVLQAGLSFSKSNDLVYLAPMIGSRGEVKWDKTPKGAVYMCQMAGSISHISDVIIVWNDEDIEVINENGEFKVNHSMKFHDENEMNFESDFKCGYVYVVYPSGYRELRMVNRQQMYDAYAKSRKKENYNKISMLKSKVVKRALNFDRTSIISSMVKVMENVKIAPQNSKSFDIDISEVEETHEVVETPEVIETAPEVVEEKVEVVEETQETTDLLGVLDLNFD